MKNINTLHYYSSHGGGGGGEAVFRHESAQKFDYSWVLKNVTFLHNGTTRPLVTYCAIETGDEEKLEYVPRTLAGFDIERLGGGYAMAVGKRGFAAALLSDDEEKNTYEQDGIGGEQGRREKRGKEATNVYRRGASGIKHNHNNTDRETEEKTRRNSQHFTQGTEMYGNSRNSLNHPSRSEYSPNHTSRGDESKSGSGCRGHSSRKGLDVWPQHARASQGDNTELAWGAVGARTAILGPGWGAGRTRGARDMGDRPMEKKSRENGSDDDNEEEEEEGGGVGKGEEQEDIMDNTRLSKTMGVRSMSGRCAYARPRSNSWGED